MKTKKRTKKPPRALLRELQPPIHLDGATYQQQYILCSKPSCTKWHGPYWYAYFRAGARTKSRYIGKNLPASVVDQVRAQADDAKTIAREVARVKRARKRAGDP